MLSEPVQLALIALASTVVVMIGVKILDTRGFSLKWKQDELSAMREDVKEWLRERDLTIANLRTDLANLQTRYTEVLLENERLKTQYADIKKDYEQLLAEHNALRERMEGHHGATTAV